MTAVTLCNLRGLPAQFLRSRCAISDGVFTRAQALPDRIKKTARKCGLFFDGCGGSLPILPTILFRYDFF